MHVREINLWSNAKHCVMMPESQRLPVDDEDEESYEDPIDEEMGTDGSEGDF